MKRLTLLLIIIVSLSQALTIAQAKQLKPAPYHPVTPGVCSGDPTQLTPIGLVCDSLFYYFDLGGGYCGSEYDGAQLDLMCQNLRTDSLWAIDSFRVYFSWEKHVKNMGDYSDIADTLLTYDRIDDEIRGCNDLYQKLIAIVPPSFQKSMREIPSHTRSYTYGTFPYNNGSETLTMTLKQRPYDQKVSSYPKRLIAHSKKRGQKEILYAVSSSSDRSDIAGYINFAKSRRLIVILDITYGRESYHFQTIGCHKSAGFKK